MFKFSDEKTFFLVIIAGILFMSLWQYNSSRDWENFKNPNQCTCAECAQSPQIYQSVNNPNGQSQYVINQENGRPITINVGTFPDQNSDQDQPEKVDTPRLAEMGPPSLLTPALNPFGPMRDFDYRALTDPLVPPLKRDDYNLPVIPIPTRGYPTAYKKVGTLVNKEAPNDDPYKFLFLMGRQRFPGSDYYDYYVTEKGSDGNGTLKFFVKGDMRRELFTGDKLKISQLGDTEYEVIADRQLNFEYNPYII